MHHARNNKQTNKAGVPQNGNARFYEGNQTRSQSVVDRTADNVEQFVGNGLLT